MLYGINIALGNFLKKYPDFNHVYNKISDQLEIVSPKHLGSNLVAIFLTVISIVFQSIYISDRLLTVLQYCDLIMERSIYDIPHNNNVPNIEGKDLETLIVASMQTLKRNNKKCGKEKVFCLGQESVKSQVTKEILKSG